MSDTETTPTQALAVRRVGALGGYRPPPEKAEFAAIVEFANYLAKVPGFLPKHFFGEPYKVMAAILYGRDLGLSNFMALQHLVPIEGKVGADAQLVGMLVRRAGHKLEDDTTNQASTVTITRADDGSVHMATFTIEDARQAQLLNKDNWKHYPSAMLYSRALTACARKGAQDALMGVAYTPEELGVETIDQDGGYGGGSEYKPAAPRVVQGEVVQEAVQSNTGVQAAPSPAASGVPEATGSLPAAAIQPASPAPSEGVQAKETPSQKETTEPVPPPAPAAAPRRSGRSVGPAPRRTNVIEVPQGAEKPATAPEAPPPATVNAEVVTSQPAPSALTEEPIVPEQAPAPVDEGEQLYLTQQRAILREAAATLQRLNVIVKNHLVHPLKGEALEPLPPAQPTSASDEALRQLIERDYPGRTLETLGVPELQNRLELIEPFISKRREQLKEKGITEE